MVPRPEGPAPPVGVSDAEDHPARARDPVRFAVQLALAVYLSPVLLIVGLIGATSILVGGMARALGHDDDRTSGRPDEKPRFAPRGHARPVTGIAGLNRGADLRR